MDLKFWEVSDFNFLFGLCRVRCIPYKFHRRLQLFSRWNDHQFYITLTSVSMFLMKWVDHLHDILLSSETLYIIIYTHDNYGKVCKYPKINARWIIDFIYIRTEQLYKLTESGRILESFIKSPQVLIRNERKTRLIINTDILEKAGDVVIRRIPSKGFINDYFHSLNLEKWSYINIMMESQWVYFSITRILINEINLSYKCKWSWNFFKMNYLHIIWHEIHPNHQV